MMTRLIERDELSALADALQSAFPDYTQLQQMLYFELGERLERIAPKAGLQDVVFTVLQHFDARGLLRALIDGAKRRNPGNPKLVEFVAALERRDAGWAAPEPKASVAAAVDVAAAGSDPAPPARRDPALRHVAVVYALNRPIPEANVRRAMEQAGFGPPAMIETLRPLERVRQAGSEHDESGPASEGEWQHCFVEDHRFAQELRQLAQHGEAPTVLHVFAFAPLPLAFHLGMLLDRERVIVYQPNRADGSWTKIIDTATPEAGQPFFEVKGLPETGRRPTSRSWFVLRALRASRRCTLYGRRDMVRGRRYAFCGRHYVLRGHRGVLRGHYSVLRGRRGVLHGRCSTLCCQVVRASLP